MLDGEPTDSELEFLKIQAEQSGLDDGAEAIECALRAEDHAEQADDLLNEIEDLQAEVDVLKEHVQTEKDLAAIEGRYSEMLDKLDAAKAHYAKSKKYRKQAVEYLDANRD